MYWHLCIFSVRLEVGSSDFCCIAHFLPLGIRRSLPSVTTLSCHRWKRNANSRFDCACYRPALLVQTVFPNNRHGQSKQDTLSQGCPNSVLEGHCPVEFRYNQVQTTRLEYSSLPGETLISWFRCVFIGVEAKLCRTRASRTEFGCPALSLPLSLTPTLHASGFPKPVQKVRFSVAREIWALIKTATGIQ